MPRKKRASLKRDIEKDPKYGDKLISKFINMIMMDGKKAVSEQIVYGALDILKEKKGDDPIKVFKDSMEKIKPIVEVKSRRVGGSTYQVPCEVRSDRRVSLGFRWLIASARKRGEKSMQERLAGELLEALQDHGSAVKKREETHRMAEANKAFAHYKW